MAEPFSFTEEQSDLIRAALARLCGEPQFVSSPSLREMLRFVVQTTLDGGAESLKAYTIATQALGRPANFDPQADPIVRVTATRLRRALESHAQGKGRDEPVLIGLERGSYVPRFVWREALREAKATKVPPTADSPIAESSSTFAPPAPQGARLRVWAGLAAIGLAILVGAIFEFAPRWWEPAAAHKQPAAARQHEKVVADAPIPALELRPTLIVGAINYTNGTKAMEAVGGQIRSRFISAIRPFDDILDVKDSPQYDRDSAAAPLTYLLETSVGLRGDNVVVSTNVSYLATGVSIHTWVYDEPKSKDFDPARVTSMVETLAVALGKPYGVISSHAWRILAPDKEVPGAYGCQLRVFRYWQTYSRETFDEAFDCVRRRLAVDPDSASALSNQAFLYTEAIRARYLLPDPEPVASAELLERALKSANKAVQAAPSSARAHSAMAAAYMINGNFSEAIASAREALSLNPRDPELLADLGAKLAQTGAYRESVDLLGPVIAEGGAQPPWRIIFAALGNYMLGENVELTRLAGMLKKEDGLLSLTVQLLAALARGDSDAVQIARVEMAEIAPKGHDQILSALANRIYNAALLDRISADIAPIFPK